MVPMRHSTIFKSRWWALIWAAGVVMTAVEVAGSVDPDPNSAGADANASSPIDSQTALLRAIL